MNTLKRTTIVCAVVFLVGATLCIPAFLNALSGQAGASGAVSASDCTAAQSWIDEAGSISGRASFSGKAALAAGDASGSVIAAVEARHDIAQLYAPAVAAQLRADTLAALDELAYQSALVVTAPYLSDTTEVSALIAAMNGDHAFIASACGTGGNASI